MRLAHSLASPIAIRIAVAFWRKRDSDRADGRDESN